MSEDAFRDNAEGRRFELHVGDDVVTADYERRPDTLVIRYVYAPPQLRGTGASDRLMSEIAKLARTEDVKVQALCGYARRWLAGHKAHRDLLVG